MSQLTDEECDALLHQVWSRTRSNNGYREIIRVAYAAGLERAAKVCEEQWHIDGSHTAKEFAAAIRSLKTQEPT